MSLKDNKRKNKKPKSYFMYDFVKITGALPTLLYLRPRIICVGKKKAHKVKGGVLISANHVSYLDPVLMYCVFWRRRVHTLATKDLFDSKMGRFFFTQMHCIEVDKDNFSIHSFHDVCDDLKKEKAVLIFPEGTVNRTGEEMLGFKSGAVLMAHMSKKPILPVCIIKTEKWYQRRVVLVGDPIDVYALCGKRPTMDGLKKVSELLREKELALMEYYQNKKGAKNAKK